jgi:hypothetical protein
MALIWHEALVNRRAETSIVQTDADDAWPTLVIPSPVPMGIEHLEEMVDPMNIICISQKAASGWR